jgi:hypothetical protein
MGPKVGDSGSVAPKKRLYSVQVSRHKLGGSGEGVGGSGDST